VRCRDRQQERQFDQGTRQESGSLGSVAGDQPFVQLVERRMDDPEKAAVDRGGECAETKQPEEEPAGGAEEAVRMGGSRPGVSIDDAARKKDPGQQRRDR
jgi:hypothetical protein